MVSNRRKVSKWPKILPEFTAKQTEIANEYIKWLHEEILPNKYKFVDRFNRNYVIKNAPASFKKTLEIGAGTGEHIFHEKLSSEQRANYTALELRENMANQLKKNHPDIKLWIRDCQESIPSSDDEFDRIIASHVLEHLRNLPAAIREIYRVCNKNHGVLSVVLPCEGGCVYVLGRKFAVARIFKKRYGQSYQWLIEQEHVNTPAEVIEEIFPYFKLVSRQFFPFNFLPFIWSNICIGLTFRPKLKVDIN